MVSQGLFGGRSATLEPKKLVARLRTDVEESDAFRLSLYRSEPRIDEIFEQWLTPIKEVLTSSERGVEVSAGALRVFGLGASRRTTDSARIELTPMIKVRLLEETARAKGRLVDLAQAEPLEGSLLSFVGDGRLVMPWESATERADNLGLSAEAAEGLQKERERWEKIQKASGKQKAAGIPEGTLVWVPYGELAFASIIGTDRANWSGIDSHPDPPHGIFGLHGRSLGSLVLVTALFIWHQQEAPFQK